MKHILTAIVLLATLPIVACGKDNYVVDYFTGPSPVINSVSISPPSAVLTVGDSVLFTAIGGNGRTYDWSVYPPSVLDLVRVSHGQVRVALLKKLDNAGYIKVVGSNSEATATISFR